MSKAKITNLRLASERLEDYKLSLQYEGCEDKLADRLEFLIPSSLSVRIIARDKSPEPFESSYFDSNLLVSNQSLSIPMYKPSRPGKIQGKVQIVFSNFSVPTTCNGSDASDSFSIKSGSPGSSNSLDESSLNKTTISQIADLVNSELRCSVIRLRKLLEIEKSSKESLTKELHKLKAESFNLKEDFGRREEKNLNEFKAFESSLSNMKFELLKVKTDNKALNAQNSRVLGILNEKERSLNELMQVVNGFRGLESFNRDDCGKAPRQLVIELDKKEQAIREINKELNELKILNKSILLNRQMQRTNDLDEILMSKAKSLKLVGQFVKDPEQNYLFNGKKIVLVARAGHILVKVGSGFKAFDEYLRSIGVNCRSASHKRIRSVDM